MCEFNNCSMVRVWIPPELSHTGKGRWDRKPVDTCIATIVEALNDRGVKTISSCCGHGKTPGIIEMEDGRKLIILPMEVPAITALSKMFLEAEERHWADVDTFYGHSMEGPK